MIQFNSGLLKTETTNDPVRLKCTLNLKQLFSSASDSERKKFDARWHCFFHADESCHSEIFPQKGDDLIYFSEHLIPEVIDDRPPLLLLLGNPASHSVKAGMFFSYEGKQREHRFWKLLSSAGILDFAFDEEPLDERNHKRKERLLSLSYDSPFRIGLAVFITFPSPASRDWSGVAGVETLFLGAKSKAMKQIIAAEKKRILECATNFLSPDGTIICFNKLTWDELRSSGDPKYTRDGAMKGSLEGHLEGNASNPLVPCSSDQVGKSGKGKYNIAEVLRTLTLNPGHNRPRACIRHSGRRRGTRPRARR